MRAVRAILGRFARFLVRVARTLDPGLVSAPYWVLPERMAALRQQYPGAPEHWLEFVARRTPNGGPANLPGPDPRTPDRTDDSYSRREPPAHSLLSFRNLMRKRERPSPGFSQSGSRQAHQDDPPHLPGAPRVARPALSFGAKYVRNPIANLLRINRPPRFSTSPQFHHPELHDRPHQRQSEQIDGARREYSAIFPDLARHAVRHPKIVSADEFDLRWPALLHGAPAQPGSFGELLPKPRPGPNFARQDPRWPELPPLAVEFGFPDALSHDELGLLAEQIGGLWSE